MQQVDFKVHSNGEFAFEPLRYVDGCVGHVVCFSTKNGTFTRALDHVMKDIEGDKWALFYCKPNMSLANGLTLIHTDNDVRRFFYHAVAHGTINLFIAHKQQPLSKFYLKNMVWQEEDAGHRCSCATPFKRRMVTKRLVLNNSVSVMNVNEGGSGIGGHQVVDEVGVQLEHSKGTDKGKAKQLNDDVIESKAVTGKKKLKEQVNGSETSKESSYQVVKTYRRAVINGRAKMVEVSSD